MESHIERFGKAQKRAKKIRGFYTHLLVFFIVNTLLYLVKADTMRLIIEESGIHEVGFANYLHWQFWTITLSWAVILIVQALKLFGRPLVAKWERRKLEEIINSGDDRLNEY